MLGYSSQSWGGPPLHWRSQSPAKFSTQQGYTMEMELIVDVPKSPDSGWKLPTSMMKSPTSHLMSKRYPSKSPSGTQETLTRHSHSSARRIQQLGRRWTNDATSFPFSDGLATFTLIPTFTGNLASDYEETIDILVTDSSNNSYTFQNRLKLDSSAIRCW